MKTNQLLKLFTALKSTSKTVRFGDLMKKGFSSPLIFNAIEAIGAEIKNDSHGYSVITFK